MKEQLCLTNYCMETMKKIINEWNTFILEQTSAKHFEVDVILRYEKALAVYGPVFNKIRAISGITIAKSEESGVVEISPNQKELILHLKFMPDRPLKEYGLYLKKALLAIKDNEGDRILSIKYLNYPRLMDQGSPKE